MIFPCHCLVLLFSGDGDRVELTPSFVYLFRVDFCVCEEYLFLFVELGSGSQVSCLGVHTF